MEKETTKVLLNEIKDIFYNEIDKNLNGVKAMLHCIEKEENKDIKKLYNKLDDIGIEIYKFKMLLQDEMEK